MLLEKTSIIIGILVIGAGILSHSVSLDNNVSNLLENHKKTSENIGDLTKTLIELRSNYDYLEKNINSNQEDLTFLQDEIRRSNREIQDSAIETRNLLLGLQRDKHD